MAARVAAAVDPLNILDGQGSKCFHAGDHPMVGGFDPFGDATGDATI